METFWPITLATRVRFRVGRWKKCESVWGNFYLPSPTLHARYGGIQKGLVGTCKVSVFVLFPVTRHNEDLVEVKPWTTDQLHTLQHSPHTCIHKKREGIKESCTPPLKKSRGYEACSKKDGLVESSVTNCWPMSPSNVTSNTASKCNWRLTGYPNWKWKNFPDTYSHLSFPGIHGFPSWYCKTLFIREDFIFA